VKDPHPEKGRMIARLEEKQGRTIHKGTRADQTVDKSE
jgi:hypothetical protein